MASRDVSESLMFAAGQELSKVEQATGNFGEATRLRNMARSCGAQSRQAMHRPAPRTKGPPTLGNGSSETEVKQSRAASSALA